MNQLTPTSLDITSEHLAQLKALFPNVFTEGKIDFDALKAELGEHLETEGERYQFTWNGKAQAKRIATTPSMGTLRPAVDESVNWDSTENLYIEGDNLEVLKLLQKAYFGKVKMIYIDPPYNTGKDFVYKDDFKDNLSNYKRLTKQVDDEGNPLTTNSDSSGRYHSNWLNMMYPRLKLARNLLRDDGVIFISIDDNEVHNLRKLCDEIFGEGNFVSCFVWNTEGNTDNQYEIKINHEYIVCYIKDKTELPSSIGYIVDPNTTEESNLWKGYADNNINKNSPANPPSIITLPIGFPSSVESLYYAKKNVDDSFFSETKKDKYISEEIKRKYSLEPKSGLPVKLDDMVVSNGKLIQACRIYVGVANKNKLLEYISNECNPILDDDGEEIEFYINANAAVRYRKKREQARNILSVLRNFGTTEKTKNYLKSLGVFFSYPKPSSLLSYLVNIGCSNSDDIVLDCFAGSASSAESVMQLNADDGGNRKFILVQIPEGTPEGSEARKAGYVTIAEIGKERIRRAGRKIQADKPDTQADCGFKVFKLDTSNIKAWNPTPDNLQEDLLDAVDNILADRTDEDLLYEVLIKYGLPLTMPIQKVQLGQHTGFSVGMGSLVACFAKDITLETVQAIADMSTPENPVLRVVFRDSGFADDNVKTNAVQRLKQAGVREEDVVSV